MDQIPVLSATYVSGSYNIHVVVYIITLCMVSSLAVSYVVLYCTLLVYFILPVHTLFIGTKMGYHTPLLLLTKVVILLLYCLSDVHGITEYYIKPTEFDNVSCPREPCHTLNYFASSTHNTWSGVVWRFCLATIA